MSGFSDGVVVSRIKLSDHPTRPDLKVGWLPHALSQVVVGDHYDEGTLGFFIPEGAIVPDQLAEEMWVKGKLAGSKRNRVKSRLMDGVETQGLFYGSRFFTFQEGQKVYHDGPSWNPTWKEGDDITTEVGVNFPEEE